MGEEAGGLTCLMLGIGGVWAAVMAGVEAAMVEEGGGVRGNGGDICWLWWCWQYYR